LQATHPEAPRRLVRTGVSYPTHEDPLSEKRLFRGAHGKLVIGVLPVSIFASGHTFFVSRLHEQLELAPYVVHATFQYSGTPGKRHRNREFMLWNDSPEYYDPGHAFVTWDMDVPASLLEKAVPQPESIECCTAQQGHFDLVNHQLLQVRHGMAVASVRPSLSCSVAMILC
jgi:arabinosyltransferase